MSTININLKNYSAVIFDMDGTMVNNMDFHFKAWNEFLERHDIHISGEEFERMIKGKKNDEIFSYLFGSEVTYNDLNKYAKEKEEIYREIYRPHLREVKGLSRIIDTIKAQGKMIAIATTAPIENRIMALDILGLEGSFDLVLGEEDASKGKPDPEIYLKAAKKLGLQPSSCLVFEDTTVGVQAAKAAQMTTIGIMTSQNEQQLAKADYLIDNFDEIILN